MSQVPYFNPFDPAFLADPYPAYHRLRTACPVWQSPSGLWFLTRHDDCAEALKDRRFGKNHAGNVARLYGSDAPREPALAWLGRTMLVLDPPDHTRLRSLVTKAFTSYRRNDMRPRIAFLVDELIDRVQGQGRMDVIADFALQLPVMTICDLIGIPKEDQDLFFDHCRAIIRLIDPVPMIREELDLANAGTLAIDAYFSDLLERRRREPKDDLATRLVLAEEAGESLSLSELTANLGLLFIAGHETTANLIGNGLFALLRNPDQWRMLKADPATMMLNAVEELLRYDCPVQMTGRTTMEDVRLSAVVIPGGESVAILLGAASRDPAVYADPDRLDIARRDIRPIAFGGGIHRCLGSQLARMEAQAAFMGMLHQLPQLRLLDPETPQWRRSFTLRGLAALPVAW